MERVTRNFWTIFANTALLNALRYVKINKKSNTQIQEKNIEDHFALNKKWISIINRNNKKNNLEIDHKELGKKIIKYLRWLRNYYSHNKNLETYKKANKLISENEENLMKKIKNIFKHSSNFMYFNDVNKEEFRLIIISLFLQRNDFNKCLDFIDNHLINKNSFNTNFLKDFQLKQDNPYQKWRFVFRQIATRDNIDFKIVNYVKTFSKMNNKKQAFFKIAVALLNWYHTKHAIKFDIHIDNSYLINVIHQEKIQTINFDSLRRLLLNPKYIDHKKIMNDFYSNAIKKPGIKESNIDNLKTFRSRFEKEASLDVRQLLKTWNKLLLTNGKDTLNPIAFELIYQYLKINKKINLSATTFDNIDKVTKEIINKHDHQKSKLAFIDNILKIIKTQEDVKNLYKYIEPTHVSNLKSSSKVSPSNAKILFFEKIDKNYIYDNIFQFHLQAKLESKQSANIKKYIAPILLCYKRMKNKPSNSPSDFLTIEDIFPEHDTDGKLIECIINQEVLGKFFAHKILKSRDKISLNYVRDTNEYQFEINHKLLESHIYDLHDKLFWEFFILLAHKTLNDQSLKNTIQVRDHYWKKINCYIDYAWDIENGKSSSHNLSKARNYIFHSSLSKFKDIEELQKCCNKP